MEKLIEGHPYLFDETASRPVVDIGIGWEDLVDRLFTQIEAIWSRRSKCRVDYVREHGGRLEASVRAYRREDQAAVDRAVLLAHFRAYYTCDECGERGEFRKTVDGWVACRCAFHQPPELMSGRLLYDNVRRPVKLTTEGWVRYDPVADAVEPMADGDIGKTGWLPYIGTHIDNPRVATGWYDVDDADEIKRLLRARTDWNYMRILDVMGDILDLFAESTLTGYLDAYGKRISVPDDMSTWDDKVGFWLANFSACDEK